VGTHCPAGGDHSAPPGPLAGGDSLPCWGRSQCSPRPSSWWELTALLGEITVLPQARQLVETHCPAGADHSAPPGPAAGGNSLPCRGRSQCSPRTSSWWELTALLGEVTVLPQDL